MTDLTKLTDDELEAYLLNLIQHTNNKITLSQRAYSNKRADIEKQLQEELSYIHDKYIATRAIIETEMESRKHFICQARRFNSWNPELG